MSPTRSNLTEDSSQNWQEIVRQHVESLRFGTVEIIIHDSRVVQIERTERVRLGKSESAAPAESPKSEFSAESHPTRK